MGSNCPPRCSHTHHPLQALHVHTHTHTRSPPAPQPPRPRPTACVVSGHVRIKKHATPRHIQLYSYTFYLHRHILYAAVAIFAEASLTCVVSGPVRIKDEKKLTSFEGTELFSEQKGLNIFKNKVRCLSRGT